MLSTAQRWVHWASQMAVSVAVFYSSKPSKKIHHVWEEYDVRSESSCILNLRLSEPLYPSAQCLLSGPWATNTGARGTVMPERGLSGRDGFHPASTKPSVSLTCLHLVTTVVSTCQIDTCKSQRFHSERMLQIWFWDPTPLTASGEKASNRELPKGSVHAHPYLALPKYQTILV